MKRRFWVLFLIVLVGFCSFLYKDFYDEAKERAINSLNEQQRLHARQAVLGIEDYLTNMTNSLNSISRSEDIATLNPSGKRLMEAFYEAHKGRIQTFIRVDPKGRIIYSVPYKEVVGNDISRQKHVQEVMRSHKPVVSDVFTAVQGLNVVALHVPVFHKGRYDGTIGIGINFQVIAQRYLEGIQIGRTGYAWMISRDGTELYCPILGHTGKTVFENCKDFPSILAMAEEMVKGREGVTTYVFDRVRGQVVEGVRKHAVYMPVKVGNTFWSIVVASSEEEVLSSLANFRNRLFWIIGLILLGGGLFSFYGLKAVFIVQEERKRKRVEEALQKSEEQARQLARENGFVAEIGRIISSTLNIDEVYERFAREAQKLISFDRININLVDHESRTVTSTYSAGSGVKGRQIREVFPLAGSAAEEVIRTRSGLLFQPEDKDELERRFPGLVPSFQAGHRSMIVVPLISKDNVIGNLYFGSTKPKVFTERDLRLAGSIGDQIAGAIGSAQLFIERKQMEEVLRESEERFRELFDHAPVSYHEFDLEGHITRVNRTELELLGYAHEEMIGQPIWKFNVEEESACKRILGKLAGDIPPSKGYELTYRRKDGATIWLLAEDRLILDSEGRITGMRGIFQDITERKRAEEERQRLEERLSRAEKMEALGTLSGGVAHDLNNVLGVLVGYSELLLMKMGETHFLRSHVSYILQASQKAAAIIQDLLTLARRGVSVSEVVNLNGLISSHLKTPEFEKLKSYHPGVTFQWKLEKDLLNIKGSPVHLEKTLINLLSNAAEAMSGGYGDVTLMTENRYLDKPITGYDDIQEGDYVILRVSDNGRGISAADIGKIFEPFYTKKVMGRSGTGLGLAVVWGTVKDHGGYIDVQSEEGRGSNFTLYFPVTREELVGDQKGVSPESYMARGESILVVDDVKEQRDLATAMLSGLGYQVSAVSSGEEAVIYLKTNRVDLLVLDMIMDPGMDGLETYQRVLEINPKQKAIIVSGFSETDRVKKAQELGAGAYVRKPYIREKIGLAIRKELDRA